MARLATFNYDERRDQVRVRSGHQKRGIPAHRLSHEDNRREVQLVDHLDDVADERLTRDVIWMSLAPTVATLVERENAMPTY